MRYNTGETSEELKENNNPEGSTLRDAQMRMLEMLIFLRDVCAEQNIKWCLEGGNVLGAVRHGGFIPWDDDADIIMERHDYNRFVKYMSEHPHPQFVLQTRKTDKGYYGTWNILRDTKSEYVQDSFIHQLRQYRGLQIDIFPIQRGNLRLFNYLSGKLYFLSKKYLISKNIFANKCISFIINDVIFPTFRALTYILGDRSHFSYEYGHSHFPRWNYKDVFPTKPIMFEGEQFPGPSNVDAYLRTIYGNYMELPPLEKRNKHLACYRIWK